MFCKARTSASFLQSYNFQFVCLFIVENDITSWWMVTKNAHFNQKNMLDDMENAVFGKIHFFNESQLYK